MSMFVNTIANTKYHFQCSGLFTKARFRKDLVYTSKECYVLQCVHLGGVSKSIMLEDPLFKHMFQILLGEIFNLTSKELHK